MKKVASILITFVAFVGFNSCEEEFEPVARSLTLAEKLQGHFDYDKFSEAIPYDFEVDWGRYTKRYSEELEAVYYEFNIRYTSTFNPEAFDAEPSKKYTVLAIEDGTGGHYFLVADFTIVSGHYQALHYRSMEGFTGTLKLISGAEEHRPLLFLDGKVTGTVKELNEEQKKIYNLTGGVPIPTDGGEGPGNGGGGGGSGGDGDSGNFIEVIMVYYTDWYLDRGNGIWEYQNSTVTGVSYDYVYQGNDLNSYNNLYNHTNFVSSGGNGGGGRAGSVTFEENTPVVAEDKVINTLTGEADCIYKKLKATNGNLFKKTIGEFIDDPEYNLTLEIGNCTSSDDACTNADDVNNIIITIENHNTNSLQLAQYILHEAIHAELYRYVSRYEAGVDPNNRARLFQLYTFYKNKEKTGNIQHVYMTENYVNPIASALRQLDGNQYPIDYYKAFAWDGLRIWDANNLLSMDENSTFESYRNTVIKNTKISCN